MGVFQAQQRNLHFLKQANKETLRVLKKNVGPFNYKRNICLLQKKKDKKENKNDS